MSFFNTEPRMRRHVGEWIGRAEELRLKGVIETAPVGLLVINDVGEVLVANQSALGLFGVEQSEDVLGKTLQTCVAVEDSKALAGFVDRVCGGESGALECQCVGSDGLRRLVEIRAVPLRRKDTTVFLGAVWDVSEPKGSAAALQEAQARYDLLAAQRSASEQALSETNKAHEDLRREYQGLAESLHEAQHQLQAARAEVRTGQEDAQARYDLLAAQRSASEQALSEANEAHEALRREHQGLTESLHEAQHQLQAARAEARAGQEDAQARYDLLAAQRSASEHALSETNEARETLRREHQGLAESLHEAQHQLQAARAEAHARQEEMAGQGTVELVAEWTTQQGALERMERQYQASVEGWTAEGQQIEQTLSDLRARHDEILSRSRDELENIAATVCKLERCREQLTDNRHAVREVLEGAVRAEREWHAVLADVQTQWQTTLSKALGTGGDASAPTEHALDSSQRRRPLTESPRQNTDDRQLPPDDSPTAASKPDENGQTERGITNAGLSVQSLSRMVMPRGCPDRC